MQTNQSLVRSYKAESGYLFLGMLALILLLGAGYTSLAFVEKKEFNWEINYAMGQQFAQVAKASHLYVQTVAYDPDYAGNPQRDTFLNGAGVGGNQVTINDLIANNFLPSNFQLNRQKYQDVQITSYADLAPRGGAPNSAPTAFTIIDITLRPNQVRTGSDIAAFRAGASSVGLLRIGQAQDSGANPVLQPSTRLCNGVVEYTRWGDNPNDCLTSSDLDVITNQANYVANLDENDAIAPSWETNQEGSNQDIVYRYPQPGRPDAQTVNVSEIRFDGGGVNNAISNVSFIDAQNLNAINMQVGTTDTASAYYGLATMTVNGGGVLAQDVSVSDDLVTEDLNGSNGMIVDGNVEIISGSLTEGGGHAAALNVSDEIAIIDVLTEQSSSLAINVTDGNDLIVLGEFTQADPSGVLAVQANGTNDGDIQAPTANIDIGPNNINLVGADASASVGQMVVDDATMNSSDFGSMTIDSGGEFIINNGDININIDCFGAACPDAITDPPANPL